MFKYKYAKLEDIPENLRQYYKESDGVWILQVEGAVPKDKLDEFRDKNIELLRKMELFKDVDPEMYKKLKEEHDKLKEGELIKAGKVEELIEHRVKTMKAEFDGRYSALEAKYGTANRQLETLLIDNEVRAVATKIGVSPTAVDDVLLRAKTVFKVVDGKPTAQNEKGEVIYGRDGLNSLSIGDWAGTLKETAPHLFGASTGSGASNNRGNLKDTAKLTPAQKIAAGLAAGGSSIQS